MENNRLEDTTTQFTPKTDIGMELAHPAPGVVPHEATRATWEDRNIDSGRPPWGLLLFGIVALSVVYWLWGREPREMPLRGAAPTPMSALTREVLPTTPTVSLPDGTILFLTKDALIIPFTVCDLFIGKSENTCIADHS